MFLSNENIKHIEGVCHGFLKDKHNIEVPTTAIKQLVSTFSQRLSKDVDPSKVSLDAFNKQVIIQVRDYVVAAMQQKQAPRAMEPMKPTVVNQDIYNVPESDKTEENQDEFFQKLQELEMQRKAPIAVPEKTAATTTSSVPSQPTSQQPLAPLAPSTPPVPPAPITVIVPSTTVANYGIITRIHSIDRSWLYNTSVSSMVWSGPLPKQIDENNIRILALMLPKICLDLSPYVILRIEGAGGQVADICVMPDSHLQSAMSSTWVKYQACIANEHIRKFATPWTIRILDAYGSELEEMGDDGWIVEETGFQTLSANISRIIPTRSGKERNVADCFKQGERIILQDTKTMKSNYVIVQSTPNFIDVKEIYKDNQITSTKAFPCCILNQSRQWALLLESYQTTHITTKTTTENLVDTNGRK